MKIKLFLLGFFLSLFGVVGSTSAFNLTVEQNLGDFDPGSSFTIDFNRLIPFNLPAGYIDGYYYSSTDLFYILNNMELRGNPYYKMQFDFSSGNWLFYLDVFNGCPYGGCWLGSYFPSTAPSSSPFNHQTINIKKTVGQDIRSYRVFTIGSLYNGTSTPIYAQQGQYTQNLSGLILPNYTSIRSLTYDNLEVYLPDSAYPAYSYDLGGMESVWRGPNYTFSTINCTNKGDNYCTAPTFTTTTTNTLTQDKLKQHTDVKNFSFQRVTYISRGNYYNNETKPYTFLGVLSGNKVEFNVFSCYNGNLETQDGCTEVLHGLTQEIFGVNYPKMYGSPCGTTLSTETGALLGQALFGNNSIHQCGSSTSLGNYFSRIDFDNHKLYVASADIPGYAEQNAIGFEVLDEYNLAQNYTGRTTSGYKQEEVNNVMASCSGHYNDPAYPGCFIVQVSSGVDPYSLSPLLPSPSKTLLQEALANSGKRDEVYNNCQNPAYYAERSFVCDNVDLRVNGYNPLGMGSGFSINSPNIKTNSCQSEFIASSSDEFNFTLGEVPLVGGIFKSLSIGDVSLTSPFACIEGAINYARNKGLDSSQTLTGSSLVTLSTTAKTKWDSFFNLLLLLPALYFIKRSGAIF